MSSPIPNVPTLSQRLEAILALLQPSDTLVDVGTDHALVPLAAVSRGLAGRAIAIDRQPAPLEAAEANRRAAGLEGQVELRLGDGLAPLTEGEGDALVLAGIGGQLAVRILEAQPARLASFRQVVVQPNQQPEAIRAWARRAGWHLAAERLVHEAGRYFHALSFRPGEGPDPAYAHPDFGPDELVVLGPKLLAARDPIARRYWEAQRDRLARLVRQPDDPAASRLALIERALEAL
jgi:tRNA (adenine22-N1)-methyltransferase